MRYLATAIIALALAVPTMSLAHKHKGWGCHHHKSKIYGGQIHCGNGSR